MTAFGVHTHRHLHRRASLQMPSLGKAQSPQPEFSELHRPFSGRFPAQTTQHVLLNTYYVLAVGLSTILRVRTSSVALRRTLSFSRGKRPVRPWGHSLGSPCASLSSRSQLSSPGAIQEDRPLGGTGWGNRVPPYFQWLLLFPRGHLSFPVFRSGIPVGALG